MAGARGRRRSRSLGYDAGPLTGEIAGQAIEAPTDTHPLRIEPETSRQAASSAEESTGEGPSAATGDRPQEGRGSGGRRGWAAFRRLWAAYAVSSFGDQLSLVALPLATFAATDSAVAVGVVASAEAVTAVLFGLVAGALADRLPHRRVLVRTDAARALVLALVAAALLTPFPDLPALIVAALVVGVMRVVHDASAGAALPILVDGEDLLAANGQLQGSESAATATGPALAGGLIALGGPAIAFLVDAVTFVASAGTLHTVRALDAAPPPAEAKVQPLPRAVADGLRALLADPPMVRLVAAGAALNIMSVCLEAQFIPYAARVLDIGAVGIGGLFALGGASAVVTSAVVAKRVRARGDVILWAVAVYAAGVALAGALPSLATAAVAFLAGGAGSALVATHLAALRQRRFAVRLQGRVTMAIRTLVLGLLPIPLVAGGSLSSAAGPEALFLVTAVVAAVVTAWAAMTGAGRVQAA